MRVEQENHLDFFKSPSLAADRLAELDLATPERETSHYLDFDGEFFGPNRKRKGGRDHQWSGTWP